jgi:ADP-ribose pyrophosphatase YjhB (NUDIX family)
MHVDEAILEPLRRQFGEPALLEWEGDVSEQEFGVITYSPKRRHDVTFFVLNGERLALVRKPHFPPDIWRPPGGGVKIGEDVVAAVVREAFEETGAEVELERYLVLGEARFRFAGEEIAWRTHVVTARTRTERLEPRDTDEIEAARWGSLAELSGPLRERLLATGRALWRYRVALHDAAASALETRRRPAGEGRAPLRRASS